MNKSMLEQLLFTARRQELRAKVRLYEAEHTRQDVEQIQVERFNAIWSYCLDTVPFYRAWREDYNLPQSISHPLDLASFPSLTKKEISSRSNEVFQNGAITDAYTTGGSMGEPTRYPRARSDTLYLYANMYLGRSWWGIEPFDECLMIWGHSHLFGRGLRGGLAEKRRQFADALVNITRLNAYDLTPAALDRHSQALARSNPVFIVGYTSALFQLAVYIERNCLSIGPKPRLRGVILTAETVSDSDIHVIERVFGCPVIVEYGTAETGVIAYSRDGARRLQVFWDSFICLADSNGLLNVTTLSPRLFPLINYSVGDSLKLVDTNSNVHECEQVLGRRQDVIKFRTVSGLSLEVSAILPIHILKSIPGIQAVQFLQSSDQVKIFLQADHRVDLSNVGTTFARELRKDHPDFDDGCLRFEQMSEAQKTLAGKQQLFRES